MTMRIICTLLAALVLTGCAEQTPARQNARPEIDKSQRAQSDREVTINRALNATIFKQVSPPTNSVARVLAGPGFNLATWDQKEAAVGAVYGFYFDGKSDSDVVVIADALTGQQIASYNLQGLKLD